MDINKKQKKAWYKKWWVWVIIVIVGIAAVQSVAENKDVIKDKAENASSEINKSTSELKKTVDEVKKEAPKPSVPAEYTSALNKATQYANTMHMSKTGVYDQLTSDYGEKFSKKAAQYAIDNVKADWKANALAKAKDYQKTMSMSPEAIRDQLTSSAGEKFTQAEADYAIKHLDD